VAGVSKAKLMVSKPTYQVVCFVCYTCIVAETSSKRDADRLATSHMNTYGHDVGIQTKGGK
jgi:hypothetical protein